jgi:carbamate kinase
VVASPRPRRIVELDAVRHLLGGGFVVITVGGGGIPVVRTATGALRGVAAVIDKDHAAAMLAGEIGASRLIISTAVEQVALHFGTPDQRFVDHLTLDDARAYLAEGTHFAAGSMAPKIEAVIDFLTAGGEEAIITTPQRLEEAVAGRAGTRITH